MAHQKVQPPEASTSYSNWLVPQTYATSGKMPAGLVAGAVLVAGATVAGTLWAAIHTVDVSLQGNISLHDGEVGKKLDKLTAEVKELRKELE